MLLARCWLLIPVLCPPPLCGEEDRSAGPARCPPRPLFIVLLIGTVLFIGALTFVPALALGPIVEHFQMEPSKEFKE